MRLGLLGRADPRGLASQSIEFARHMDPEVILIVDMGPLTPYPMDLSQYPASARVVSFNGSTFPDEDLDWFLGSCDVIFSAETVYDVRLLEEARRRGVRTVVQANFEFLGNVADPNQPRPDLFLSPSTWHLADWPDPTVYLPFPVATDRLEWKLREKAQTFVHVAGHRASRDRNGTRGLEHALRWVKKPIEILIHTQTKMRTRTSRPGGPRISIQNGTRQNYWENFQRGDVAVFPRRYGGQNLSQNEAMACGFPVVALAISPQTEEIPGQLLLPTSGHQTFRGVPGVLDWYDFDPRVLAKTLEGLADDPGQVRRLSLDTREWVKDRSWEVMAPQYRKVLESV